MDVVNSLAVAIEHTEEILRCVYQLIAVLLVNILVEESYRVEFKSLVGSHVEVVSQFEVLAFICLPGFHLFRQVCEL